MEIVLIDTNVFKYYLDGKFETPEWKTAWDRVVKENTPYITSATLCEYLTSRINQLDDVRKTIARIKEFMIVCDSNFSFVGLDKNKGLAIINLPDIYDIPNMNDADLKNYLCKIGALKAASEINYLYTFIEAVRRVYIYVVSKHVKNCNEVLLKDQLMKIYGENNKKYACCLADLYRKSSKRNIVDNYFSAFFYEAIEECFSQINELFGIKMTNIYKSKNFLLHYIANSLGLNSPLEIKQLKREISDAVDENKHIMSCVENVDIKEELSISDAIEKMFLSNEKIKLKKNDLIDYSFMGCADSLLKDHSLIIFSNDKILCKKLNQYKYSSVLLSDLIKS